MSKVQCENCKVEMDDVCQETIDWLWKEIIYANHGTEYGDWEYPAQAGRHIKAEFDAYIQENEKLMSLLKEASHIIDALADMDQQWRKAIPNYEEKPNVYVIDCLQYQHLQKASSLQTELKAFDFNWVSPQSRTLG